VNTLRLASPYEHLTGEDQQLGEGLTTAELFYWADKKRQQNEPHWLKNHEFCRRCKNCLCGRRLIPFYGFRCICDTGKTYVTPYRIRFWAKADRDHYVNREIYCLTHHIYEKRGEVCA